MPREAKLNNMLHLTDSHAHLNDSRYRQDLPMVLERARDTGVHTIITVGYDLKSSLAAVHLAAKMPGVYAAVGIHPHDASAASPEALQELRRAAANKKVVAVGEMGLDYYYDRSPRETQRQVFREQIRLARELGKPVIVHDRDAHNEVLAILREERADDVGGVMHCFSGDTSFAAKCLELGFYISLAGPVTFKNAGDLHRVARFLPKDKLLLETDAPYLTPVPHRGQRNEPAYVRYVAERVAELRVETLQDLAEQTSRNAALLFSLDQA